MAHILKTTGAAGWIVWYLEAWQKKCPPPYSKKEGGKKTPHMY
jgi:hypothetical protein